jgi:hypothetical protein
MFREAAPSPVFGARFRPGVLFDTASVSGNAPSRPMRVRVTLGRTLSGSQMSSFEFLCIVERERSLAYMAMPNGRSPATYFMLTNITPDSATLLDLLPVEERLDVRSLEGDAFHALVQHQAAAGVHRP